MLQDYIRPLILEVIFLVWLTGCTPDHESTAFSDGDALPPLSVLELDHTGLLISEVTGYLVEPWDITWGPDQYLWFTEHQGYVSRMNPETGQRKKILKVADVHYEKSRGLLSMALHPRFEENPMVYLHYTYLDSTITGTENIRSKLVRYRYDKANDTLTTPETILADIPGTTYHNGSRMIITPDEKIILSTGDAGNPTGSQDPEIISGKMLRINLDGTLPMDNPSEGSYVYTIGHRNAQGLVWANDRIYSSEHGPNNDDEINIIEGGSNYGWPDVEGFCNTEAEKKFCDSVQIKEPLISWTPTIAPSGLAYYDNPLVPEWHNSLLLTTLKGRSFRVLQLDESGSEIINERIYFQKVFGRMRDVCVAPNGDIYIATSNTDWHPKSQAWMYDNLPLAGYDKIIRLSPMNSGSGKLLSDSLPIIKEDSAQMSLFPENFTITVDAADEGTRLYVQHCASCHMPGGEGIAGLIPPLTNSDWLKINRTQLIGVVLKGMSEEIVVNGVKYHQEMPGFAASLTDKEITLILNFVGREFMDDPGEILESEIAESRK